MKKILLLLCVLSGTQIYSQTINIPDSNFEQDLIDLGYDTNGLTGNILISDALTITVLHVDKTLDANNKITDLTGIEAMTNLTSLAANYNDLTYIDVSQNHSLNVLYLGQNKLTTIDVSNNTNLQYFGLDYQQEGYGFTEIDVSSNTNLISLWIQGNDLATIDVSNNVNLETLYVFQNNLTNIDLSNNINLRNVNVDSNQLTNLDLSNNVLIYKLHFYDNLISTIDVSMLSNLERLYVSKNLITSIDITNNPLLWDFRGNENAISSIDVTQNPLLIGLDMVDTDLTTIDVTNNPNLLALWLDGCDLSELNVEDNTLLQELTLSDNAIENLDLSNHTSIYKLMVQNNELKRLNIANGNNSVITELDVTGNPDLQCLQVDDEDYATTNWVNIDLEASFSEDCSGIWEIYVPDTNMENAIYNVTGIDTNNDGIITFTEASNYTGVLDLSNQNITDITGVSSFANISTLNLSENNITDLSELLNGNALVITNRGTGETTTVNTNLSNLQALYVSENLLEHIDITELTSLQFLDCNNNDLLTSLNVANGNNVNMQVIANNNIILECIQIDADIMGDIPLTWEKDDMANYSIDCESTLAVADFSLKNSIRIYPNPASTVITIDVNNDIDIKDIKMYNIEGRLINTFNDSNQINMASLKNGLYLLEIISNKGKLIKRVIKQ